MLYVYTNEFLITMNYDGMDKSTVSRIIVRMSEAIASLTNIYIKLPQTRKRDFMDSEKFF